MAFLGCCSSHRFKIMLLLLELKNCSGRRPLRVETEFSQDALLCILLQQFLTAFKFYKYTSTQTAHFAFEFFLGKRVELAVP